MWQRFTESARRVLFHAQERALAYGSATVSTGHLLLGILQDSSSLACRLLTETGQNLSALSQAAESLLEPAGAPQASRELQLTNRSKRIIDLAYDEARQLGNNYISTEHLLLGLIREEEGTAGKLLRERGISLEEYRQRVGALQNKEALTSSPGTPPPAAGQPIVQNSHPRCRRYTSYARRVVFFAQQEARHFGADLLAPEHLLLGLLRESDTVTAIVLRRMGASRKELTEQTERLVPRSERRTASDLQLSPEGKRVIDLAFNEAQLLKNPGVGTEHLLLALLHFGEGIVGQVLTAAGLELEKTRTEIRQVHAENKSVAPPTHQHPEKVHQTLRDMGRFFLHIAPYLKDLTAEELRTLLFGDEADEEAS